MTETSHDICSICRRPRQQSGSGSLTQWINYCRCGANSAPGAIAEQVIICRACSKRINERRSGSLTQWIFAEHICKCKEPQPISVDSSSLKTDSVAFNDTDIDDESIYEEIEVDDSLFPVDRYKPLKLLGRGGLGQVYLCRDLNLKKMVAVKSLIAITDDRIVSFQQEAKIASKLNHQNIIKVFDFGTASGGRPFMVMEYFNGQSLQDLLTECGRIDENEAGMIFSGVCEALHHLHEHNVFHRDLKPSNILIGQNDHGLIALRLIDFGLSKTTQDVQSRTFIQGRTVVGTPAYMSPDQVSGLEYDARSEIYSLGCIMYEALSGKPPFSGETSLEVLNKHTLATPEPLQEVVPDLSNEFCAIVEKCLSKSREERFQSAREILESMSQEELSAESFAAGNYDDNYLRKQQSDKSNRMWIGFAIVAAIAAIAIAASVNSIIGQKPVDRKISDYLTTPGLDAREVVMENEKAAKRIVRDRMDSDARVLELGRAVSDDDLANLEGKTSLWKISLTNSPITDKAFAHLAKVPNLTSLDLERTGVKTLKGIDQLKKLEDLSLNGTTIDDDELDELKKLKKLKALELANTKITDRGIEKLSGLDRLVILKLDEASMISAESIKSISRMKGLRHIDVRGTKLTEADVEELASSHRGLLSLIFDGTAAECEKLESKFPEIQFEQNKMARIHDWQREAVELQEKGMYLPAIKIWQKCVDVVMPLPRTSFSPVVYLREITHCYIGLKQFDLAEKSERFTHQFEKKYEKTNNQVELESAMTLFAIAVKRGDVAKANSLNQQILNLSAKVFGRPSEVDAAQQFKQACWLLESKQSDRCLRATRQLRKDYKALYGGADPYSASVLSLEGKCLTEASKTKEGVAKLQEALAIYQRFPPRSLTPLQTLQRADAYSRLVEVFMANKKIDKALELADEALEAIPSRPDTRSCHIQLLSAKISMLESLKRHDEAKQLGQERKKLLEM